MTPAILPLIIYQGSTFRYLLRALNGTEPLDLTDVNARMQLRESQQSPDVLLELSTDNQRITINGETGEITLLLTAEETAALDFVTAKYDLELIFPNGDVQRLVQGKVKLSREVTRG